MGIANETTLSAWYDEYGTDVLRYCFMFRGGMKHGNRQRNDPFRVVR